jgi:hypothetical protein
MAMNKKPAPAAKKAQDKVKMTAKATPGKAGPASKGGPNLSSKVAKRVGTVAREARDVVTAVSSVAKAGADAARTRKTFALKETVKDLPKQVKEVGTAAKKGKVGTAPMVTKAGKESRMKTQATVSQNYRSAKKK